MTIKISFKIIFFIFILSVIFLYGELSSRDFAIPTKVKTLQARVGPLKDKTGTPALFLLTNLSSQSPQRIKEMKISYDVRVQREWKVSLKMSAYVKMKKEGNGYISTFRLTKPVGVGLWGKFAMLAYGIHTEEYKKMVESLESTVIERFTFSNNRFITESIIEVLPEKKRSKGNNGFKIVFSRKENEVKYWESKDIEERFVSTAYNSQQGPLTAFFNYLLFEKPNTEFIAINLQRQSKFLENKKGRKSKSKNALRPLVSQRIKVGRNNSGTHMEYPYAVFLMTENFFDIVYGKYIYYSLTLLPGTTLKIPDSAFVKGIINKSKFRKRAKMIRRLKKRKLSKKTLRKKLEEIESMSVLSAKNVMVKFDDANVTY